MDHFTGRQSRPASAQRSAPVSQQAEYRASEPVRHHSSAPAAKRPKKLAFGVLALAVLGLLGLLAWSYLQGASVPGAERGKYQAVFLTNGQVYFGKLSALSGGYYKLTDIFYLQANDAQAASDNPQNAAKNQNSNVQLIKLGSEVHGPEDAMIIGKDQMLFFENLKTDGKVSTTIADYKKK